MDLELSSRSQNHSEGVALWFSSSKLSESKEMRRSFYGFDMEGVKGKSWVLVFHSVNDFSNPQYTNENDDSIIFYQTDPKVKISKRSELRIADGRAIQSYPLMNSTVSFRIVYKGKTVMVYARDKASDSYRLLMTENNLKADLQDFYLGVSGSTGALSSQSTTFKDLTFISDKNNYQIRSSKNDNDEAPIDLFGVKQALGNTTMFDKYDALYNNMTLEQIDDYLGRAQRKTEFRIESILKDFSTMMKEEQLISDLIQTLSVHVARNITDNPKFLLVKKQVEDLELMLKDVDEHFEELEEILGKVNFDVMTDFHLKLLDGFSEEIDRVKSIYLAEIEKSNQSLKELVDFTLEQEQFAKEMNDALAEVLNFSK